MAAFARGCCWEPRLGWLNAAPPVLLATVLMAGLFYAWWSVQRTDAVMREDLRRQAMLVAQAVDPAYVKALSGTREDMRSAEYERIRQQFRLAKQVNEHWEWLYLMGRWGDGRVFFFLDSEPDDDPDASLPGDVYDEATPLLHRAFDTATSIVEGPETDMWGTWVSGLAPVLNPATGDLLAMAGIDVEAGKWAGITWRAGVFPLVVTVLLAGIVILGRMLLYIRSTREKDHPGWMRFIEAALAALIGTTLALTIAWETHVGEARNHFNSFVMQANAKATHIQDMFRGISGTTLEGLAAFLETTPLSNQDMFLHYTRHLTENSAVLAWQWLPFVPEHQKNSFETEMLRMMGYYQIWERDATDGLKVPAGARSAYYPVAYSAPLQGSEVFLGYDVGSGPKSRDALETALLTGLTTGTDSFDLYQGEWSTKGVLVFRAVSKQLMPESVSRPDSLLHPPGFAAAVLHMEILLQDTVSGLYAAGGHPLTNIRLYQMRPDASPELLGTTHGSGARSASRFPFQVSRPLFAFGKTYAATVTPTAAFDALHPVTAGLSVLLSGLFMTGAVTLVVGVLAVRREQLKRLVVARTASLRKNERRLRTALAQAEEATRVKSEFLANMSHEIRTPLNAIIGMTELVQDESLNDAQKEAFQTIAREAGALLDIINDILDFSKIEAGHMELEQEEFDLRDVLEHVADVFAHQAEMKGLEYLTYLAPETPEHLRGDPLRLRQILLNLLGNALKFTNKGEILVSVTMFDLPEPKENVTLPASGAPGADTGISPATRPAGLLFQVRDTGIGIPEHKLSDMFESFTQADGSTTRKYGGTGLGLAICKRFVELMGGEIGVQSTEGSGSTFWFKVVLNAVVEDGRSDVPAALAGVRALVVDDNATNRLIFREYLSSWGCIVLEAGDGPAALAELSRTRQEGSPIDLVLTDLHMPIMDGLELTTAILRAHAPGDGHNQKWDAANPGPPVIILCSSAISLEGPSPSKLGISATLTKPVKREELRRVMEFSLGIRHHRDPDAIWITPQAKHHLTGRPPVQAREQRKHIRILLVEDYPANQQVALRHLYQAGYTVDLAENGSQAVEAFKQNAYDLILMDIQMPVMDGYEATRRIRKEESGRREAEGGSPEPEVGSSTSDIGNRISEPQVSGLPHETGAPSGVFHRGLSPQPSPSRTPIIAMTAHALKGYRETCLEAGMDDYISKPVRRLSLLAIVEKWTLGIPTEDATRVEPDAPQDRDEPMDYARAVDEFEGDEDFLREVIQGFLDTVDGQLTVLERALTAGEAETVAREAHAIKGGAANLTADALAAAARELENMGRSGDLEKGRELLAGLEREYGRLKAHLDRGKKTEGGGE